MREPFAYCSDYLRETDRDRYLATLFAPADRREVLFALYAFAAEIDRVRDLARETMPGEIRLQWWREVILGERAGEAAANPVAAAVTEILARFDFVREPLVDLVEAHRFDVHNEPMQSIEELELYAARTAGTIFDLAVRLLGSKTDSMVINEFWERTDDCIRALSISAARYTGATLCAGGYPSTLWGRPGRYFRDACDTGIARCARRAAVARPSQPCSRR